MSVNNKDIKQESQYNHLAMDYCVIKCHAQYSYICNATQVLEYNLLKLLSMKVRIKFY